MKPLSIQPLGLEESRPTRPPTKQRTSTGCLAALPLPSREKHTPLSPRTIQEAKTSAQPAFNAKVDLDATALPKAKQMPLEQHSGPPETEPRATNRPPEPRQLPVVCTLSFRRLIFNHDPSEEIVIHDLTSPQTIKLVEAVLRHAPVEEPAISDLRELPTRPPKLVPLRRETPDTVSKVTIFLKCVISHILYSIRMRSSIELVGRQPRRLGEILTKLTLVGYLAMDPPSLFLPSARLPRSLIQLPPQESSIGLGDSRKVYCSNFKFGEVRCLLEPRSTVSPLCCHSDQLGDER